MPPQGYFRRQRYKCIPVRAQPHFLKEEMSRRVLKDPTECERCERVAPPWEGPRTADHERYTTWEVASALVKLGSGGFNSYRRVGEGVRDGLNRLSPTRAANLAEDWVESYAPVVFAAYAEQAWPAVISVDSLHFFVHPVHEIRDDLTSPRVKRKDREAVRAFSVLIAVGYDANGDNGRLWKLEAVKTGDQVAWEGFFGSLSGQPHRIVCDEDPAIRAAIGHAWPATSSHPGPLIWLCHWHLRNQLKQTFVSSDPLKGEVDAAFQDPETWEAFRTKLLTLPPTMYKKTHSWVRRHEALVAFQLNERLDPVSSGAGEILLNAIEDALGPRARHFRNKVRTDRLLALVQLQILGRANEAAYARAIRAYLKKRHGRPPTPRRSIVCKENPKSGRVAYTL